jgi:hypothetical protein
MQPPGVALGSLNMASGLVMLIGEGALYVPNRILKMAQIIG